MTGGARRSFSGDEELTPPQYRTLPAQTAPEACQPPRTSREFSPSLKTGYCLDGTDQALPATPKASSRHIAEEDLNCTMYRDP
ncbi:UNVERIFIED_CONTAM: hypothetical protein K2H54_018514 [Gekko kuhli]